MQGHTALVLPADLYCCSALVMLASGLAEPFTVDCTGHVDAYMPRLLGREGAYTPRFVCRVRRYMPRRERH